MKKILLMVLALATLAFVGCTNDGGETTDNEKLVLTNSQWTPSEESLFMIAIYDFNLFKEGYVTIGVRQEDQGKYYVLEWAAYSESMQDDGTLRVTFQTIDGEAIWKVKKVDDNTCLVYFPNDDQPAEFKRVEPPFTLYLRD